MKEIVDIEGYLEYVGQFCESRYGLQFRSQFRDKRGTAELAMLASPTKEEYEQLKRAVAIMTDQEKKDPENMTEQQIKDIADTIGADCGNVTIFINGFVLARKNHRASEK